MIRCAALILAALAWPRLGQSEPEGRARVQIRLIDQATVPLEVMRRAIEDVSYILSHAGADAAWLDCSSLKDATPETRRLCNQDPGPTDFWLHLTVARLRTRSLDSLGTALLVTSRGISAYAYYPDIEAFAENLHCTPASALAAVIAHEIGHLLLGAAHSRTGIMSARLTSQNIELLRKGMLFFTPEEVGSIRAVLSGAPQTITGGATRK